MFIFFIHILGQQSTLVLACQMLDCRLLTFWNQSSFTPLSKIWPLGCYFCLQTVDRFEFYPSGPDTLKKEQSPSKTSTSVGQEQNLPTTSQSAGSDSQVTRGKIQADSQGTQSAGQIDSKSLKETDSQHTGQGSGASTQTVAAAGSLCLVWFSLYCLFDIIIIQHKHSLMMSVGAVSVMILLGQFDQLSVLASVKFKNSHMLGFGWVQC